MKLLDALKQLNSAKQRSGPEFEVSLVSGCSPLTLTTFLNAHLCAMYQDRIFKINEALYGDLINSLQSGYASGSDAVALLVEYSSLDPRLGLRRSSSWGEEAIADIVQNVRDRLDQLQAIIRGAANRRTVVHPPVLQLPPVAGRGSWQQSSLEASLGLLWAQFCTSVLDIPGVFLVRPEAGAIYRQRDVNGELSADFPYDQFTVSAICEGLAKNILPPPALKGIITDLDDTLWRGLVGEVGPDGVHWTLDGKSQIHAVYQQLLAAAGSRGILVAVASKNDQSVVDLAMQRDDLLLGVAKVYPIIASWDPKSRAVEQILKIWNVGADSVVFVDDNPYELDEVARANPGIHTVQFHPNDAAKTFAALTQLRDLCYRETQSQEDGLRLASIRASAEIVKESAGAASMDEFLAGLQSSIKFETKVPLDDKRPFELVNKTNQFNLNGKRYSESEWAAAVGREGGFSIVTSYSDKFGALGRIAVLLGHREDGTVVIDQWVQSCRAFSRRIEHATLRLLLEKFPDASFRFAYAATEKNRPLREMIGSFIDLDGNSMTVQQIAGMLPPTYATITVTE